jgi:ribosome-interacting GTPase 1
MPANTTPEYKAAEAAFRRARDPRDQLDCLREMLRTIPKHKGTEAMRADIKTRIKELTEALTGPKAGGARSGPPTVIRPEGAAQIALVGPPNTGKSALHDKLTGSHSQVGDYPFTTQFPVPGMLMHDDVAIQVVDLPPITPEHPVPWIANALQTADGCLLVVDLAHPGCMEEVVELHQLLEERRVHLTPLWPVDNDHPRPVDDAFATVVPTVLVANKADLIADIVTEMRVFEELTRLAYPMLAVSADTGDGLDRLGAWLFSALEIVRIYTKIPGEPADMTRPFTLRRGATVHDVAVLVHKDIAAGLRFARIWGPSGFDGAHAGPDHVVADGDVVELHF